MLPSQSNGGIEIHGPEARASARFPELGTMTKTSEFCIALCSTAHIFLKSILFVVVNITAFLNDSPELPGIFTHFRAAHGAGEPYIMAMATLAR